MDYFCIRKLPRLTSLSGICNNKSPMKTDPCKTALRVFAAAALMAGGATLPLSAQYARVLTTSGDRSRSLEQSVAAVDGNDTYNSILLTDRRNQQIDGFGYAITYAACYNLFRMTPAERSELLRRTFSPTDGYGVSYVRISIGCNDFSSDEYTLCDEKGPDNDLLKNFRLHSDETDYVIPVMKEILSYNPDVKVIAAPWTPPLWMKVHADDNDRANPWTGGRLRTEYRKAYGEYFARFVKAMADNGIRIHAVSPQNEPLNAGNSASLWMPWDEEADFVKYGLAPALHRAGLDTKIYLFDHNYNYDNKADQRHYPILAYNRMGTGFEGADLVAGSCWHNYGGQISDIVDGVINARKDKELIFTESSIGTWNDGRNLWQRLPADMEDLVIQPLGNRFKASMAWNFMLDEQNSPHRGEGACATCFGAIDLVATNPTQLRYNSHYYIMAHASDAVRPGAYRVDTDNWDHYSPGVNYNAFVNPDGSTGILLCNSGNTDVSDVKVTTAKGTYHFDVPARGIVSARMDLPEHPMNSTGTVKLPMEASDLAQDITIYDLTGRTVDHPLSGTLYVTSTGLKVLYR